jgi:phage baseplate assembly protein W
MLRNKKFLEIVDEIEARGMQIDSINIDAISAKIDKKLFERIDFNVESRSSVQVINGDSNYDGSIYLLTPEQSLAVMIFTAKGERVGRPTFGSDFYKLVDGELNDIWILRAKKAILECTRDEITGKLWDDRVDIKDIKIEIYESTVSIGVEL